MISARKDFFGGSFFAIADFFVGHGAVGFGAFPCAEKLRKQNF